jgi:hypothetical protein
MCQDPYPSTTSICLLVNGSQVILDFSTTPQILLIESSSSVFVFINFFPASLLFVSLAILEGMSYSKCKQTNLNLSMLIFSLNVETFCCYLVIVYSLIYAALGLSATWVLFVAHITNIVF